MSFYPKHALTTVAVDLTSVVVRYLHNPLCCLLPHPAGSAYWILECAKQWRVSHHPTLTEASAQSNLAVDSPELRVRRRVHPPLRANHSHLAQASIWCPCTLICPFFALQI
jgi:hypothetical protein